MDGLHISEFFLISIHFNILQPGHPCFFLVYSCLFCIPDELNHDVKISLRGSFTNNYWTKINTATGSSFTDTKNSFWQDMLHMCEQKSVISLWELIHLCDFLRQASFNLPLDWKVWFGMAPDFKWYYTTQLRFSSETWQQKYFRDSTW